MEGREAGMAAEDGERGCKEIIRNDTMGKVKDRGAGSHGEALQKWLETDGSKDLHTKKFK